MNARLNSRIIAIPSLALALFAGPVLAAGTASGAWAKDPHAARPEDHPCGLLPAPAQPHNPHCTHGGDPAVEPDPAEPGAALERDAPETVPPAPCPGDGVSGQRVQVLYGYPSGTVNHIDDKVEAIRKRVARADYYLNNSGSQDAGSQHVRWLCRADRFVQVTPVKMVPIGADGQFTFDDMVTSLTAQVRLGLGPVDYAADNRVYLVFMDYVFGRNAYTWRGQATLDLDDRADPAVNRNNHRARYALVAQWSGEVALHELGHAFGAVQNSAPHTTWAGHCFQERDVMCYRDGGPYFAAGGDVLPTCPDAPPWKFDCGKEDYYQPAPAPGSYLATHWNTANSGFLTRPQ